MAPPSCKRLQQLLPWLNLNANTWENVTEKRAKDKIPFFRFVQKCRISGQTVIFLPDIDKVAEDIIKLS